MFLKEKGVPGSLCDLIANMLNCSKGALRNDEAYNDLTEVRDYPDYLRFSSDLLPDRPTDDLCTCWLVVVGGGLCSDKI